MKFYSTKMKKPVMVPESKITYRKTKNNRKMAVGTTSTGEKVYRFVK